MKFYSRTPTYLRTRFRWRNLYEDGVTVSHPSKGRAWARRHAWPGWIGTELIAVSVIVNPVVICFYPKGTRVR